MKVAKQTISLTLAALMLFTGMPVRALGVKAPAVRNLDQAALKAQVEAAISESRPQSPYGYKVPTEEQIIGKIYAAMKRMEDSPTLEDEIKKLTPEERKQLEAMKKDFDAETDKFMAEHAYELKDFPKEKQRMLAGASVTFGKFWSDIKWHWKEGPIEKAEIISLGVMLSSAAVGLLCSTLREFATITREMVNLLEVTEAAAGVVCLSALIGLIAVELFTGSVDYNPFYSDKAYVPTEHGRRLGNNEQIKKEFLADPLGALGLLGKLTSPTQTDVQSVYRADIEGATMFNDAADILYYAPRYNPQDARYQAYFKKTLYMQTLYWQQLSKQEKIKYLHEFATELKEETRKAVAKFNSRVGNIGTEQKVSLKVRP